MSRVASVDGLAQTRYIQPQAPNYGGQGAYSSVPILQSIDMEQANRQFAHEVCFSWAPKFATLFLTRTLGNASNTNFSLKPIWDELFLEIGEGATVYYLVMMLGAAIAKAGSKSFGIPNHELAGVTFRELQSKVGQEITVGFKNKKTVKLTPQLFNRVSRLKFLAVLGATAFGVYEQFILPFYRNWLSTKLLNTGSFFEVSGFPPSGTEQERETQRLYVEKRAEKFIKWATAAFGGTLALIGGLTAFGKQNLFSRVLKVIDFEGFFGFSRFIFALTLGTDLISYPLGARMDLKSGKNPELKEVLARACAWVVPCALFLKDQMVNLSTWIIGSIFGVKNILTPFKEATKRNQTLDLNRVHLDRIKELEGVKKLTPKQKEGLFKQIKMAKNVYVYLIALSIGIGVNIANYFRTKGVFQEVLSKDKTEPVAA